MCSKLFPSCFLGLESCVHFHPANIYKYTSKHLKPARRICELMESVNPGCELTNASGWPAFGTFRMVYSSMCFPSFVVLFSAVTTAGSEGLLFLRTKMFSFSLWLSSPCVSLLGVQKNCFLGSHFLRLPLNQNSWF